MRYGRRRAEGGRRRTGAVRAARMLCGRWFGWRSGSRPAASSQPATSHIQPARYRGGKRVLALAVLALMLTAGPAIACDLCARMPGTPLLFEHPAAIELAQAAFAAAESGRIELNPRMAESKLPSEVRPGAWLDDLSARQLMHDWSQSRAGRIPVTLRLTLDVQFVDTSEVCELDLRFGQIIARDVTAGPADVRLATTKAGWYALLKLGLTSCESLRLVVLDSESGAKLDRVKLLALFPAPSQPSPPAVKKRPAAPTRVDPAVSQRSAPSAISDRAMPAESQRPRRHGVARVAHAARQMTPFRTRRGR